ncbi:MAG: hypothetical protein ACRD0H_08100, partial [Actinomycetes bacterium]
MSTPQGHRNEFDGGQVVPFPGITAPTEVPGTELEPAPEVLDAELVEEAEYARRKTLPVRV